MHQRRNEWNLAGVVCFCLALQGCLKDEAVTSAGNPGNAGTVSTAGAADPIYKSTSTVAAKPSTTTPGNGKGPRWLRTATNTPPTISGTPATTVVQDSAYGFVPVASDSDGDVLTFSIANSPRWAMFDTATGSLAGLPGEGDVGTYSDILISVDDGQATAQLAAFAIEVQAYGSGSATLSWSPPTENADGSALLDLAGYRIYWGQRSSEYTDSLEISNAGITTYVIDNLASGTYYFAMTALNGSGAESDYSAEATRSIP